jgi:hypothetical protein
MFKGSQLVCLCTYWLMLWRLMETPGVSELNTCCVAFASYTLSAIWPFATLNLSRFDNL